MADFGTSKRQVFEEVHRKLDGKLHGWAEQFLSPARKEVLIKVVAKAMPCYAMSCFKLPVTLCKEIEAAITRLVGESYIIRAPCLLACYMTSILSGQLSSLLPLKNHPLGDGKAFSKGAGCSSLDCVGVLEMALKSRGLIWHFSTHGQDIVWSGYELALHLQRNGELGGKGAGVRPVAAAFKVQFGMLMLRPSSKPSFGVAAPAFSR
ncbi:unnamed protein product [Prunus brigantina]